MSENGEKQTPVEQALAELRKAQSAGALRPTPLDTKALLDGSCEEETPWIIRHRKVVAAASIMFAAGVWVSMFVWQLGDVQNLKLAGAISHTNDYAAASVQRCVAGPSGALSPACKSFDLDTDGDVDLADFSSMQLAYTSP